MELFRRLDSSDDTHILYPDNNTTENHSLERKMTMRIKKISRYWRIASYEDMDKNADWKGKQ